jgi:hypothetical protein
MTTIAQQLHDSATHRQDAPDPSCPVCNPDGYKNSDTTKMQEARPLTVDITPEGCKTPEGQAKVALAVKEMEDQTAEVANLCWAYIGEYGAAIRAALPELAEVTTDLQQAIALRQEKQEAFFIALSGK